VLHRRWTKAGGTQITYPNCNGRASNRTRKGKPDSRSCSHVALCAHALVWGVVCTTNRLPLVDASQGPREFTCAAPQFLVSADIAVMHQTNAALCGVRQMLCAVCDEFIIGGQFALASQALIQNISSTNISSDAECMNYCREDAGCNAIEFLTEVNGVGSANAGHNCYLKRLLDARVLLEPASGHISARVCKPCVSQHFCFKIETDSLF
jgi:hypothetical protein